MQQKRLRQKSGSISNQEQKFTATVAQWYTHQCGSKAPGTLSSYQYAVNDITYYDKTWEGYLMRYPDGKLVSPNALTEVFSRFVKKNNFKPLRFHDLRNSCASILYANGTDLMTIQEILGHAQLTTTISYTHKISDRKGKALADMSERFFPENHTEKEEPEN